MTDKMVHRGPDGSGYMHIEKEECNIGLGHRRLSIIDLSDAGQQPMYFEHLIIVFNGEIYNYKEVRNKLILEGYQFTTESDTEVVLKGIHLWGMDILPLLNGMWSFALLNQRDDKIILCRDRSGVKPMNYSLQNNSFIFGSELQALKEYPHFNPSISKEALSLYFLNGYISNPLTIYNNTFKLEPGHFLTFNILNQEIKKECYWNIVHSYDKPKLDASYQEIKKELHQKLVSSFQYRMVADVEVGMFLSGGIDSSLVSSLLQNQSTKKINTFTIGIDEASMDEAPQARNIATHLGTNHNELYVTKENIQHICNMSVQYFDEPFADSSKIPTMLVSQFASKKLKVSLSADGGDELFGGYTATQGAIKWAGFNAKYSFVGKIINKSLPLLKLSFLNESRKVQRLLSLLECKDVYHTQYHYNQFLYYRNIQAFGMEDQRLLDSNEYKIQDISRYDEVDQSLLLFYKTFLINDGLYKVDRSTMAFSLEGREPFLDYQLIEYACQIPSQYKINDKTTKYILRDILSEYIPQEIMTQRKQGFSIHPGILNHHLKSIMTDKNIEVFKNDDYHINYEYARLIKIKYETKLRAYNEYYLLANYLEWILYNFK